MKKILLIVFIIGCIGYAMAQDKEPSDEQLAIQFLKAQVEWQARVIQNLQKQLKECTPQK